MSDHTEPRRPGPMWRPLVAGAAGLALLLAACSNDSAGEDADTGVDVPVEPADGAADGVVDLSEDGLDLDDGNVPGTETDAEVDAAEEDVDIDIDTD